MEKKKLLHVMMGTHNPDFARGLDSVFECLHFDWTVFSQPVSSHIPHLAHLANKSPDLNTELLNAFNNFKPDVVFIHTQCDVISKEVANIMMQSAICYNWTGDIRFPLQHFYFDFGKYITATLFTNMNDVETLNKNGVNADYLQVGFDSVHFNPLGKISPTYPEIIFLGSHYPHVDFPLTKLRHDMVMRLKSEFGNNFGVYGGGWNGLESGNITSYEEEGTAYRSCKIAINLSHFAYKR